MKSWDELRNSTFLWNGKRAIWFLVLVAAHESADRNADLLCLCVVCLKGQRKKGDKRRGEGAPLSSTLALPASHCTKHSIVTLLLAVARLYRQWFLDNFFWCEDRLLERKTTLHPPYFSGIRKRPANYFRIPWQRMNLPHDLTPMKWRRELV